MVVNLEPTEGSDALALAWRDLKQRFEDRLRDEAAKAGLRAAAFETIVPLLPRVHADCMAGSALACWLYDANYELMLGFVTANAETGRAKLEEPCRQGNLVACALAGESLDNPSGFGGDPVSAVRALMTACDGGLVDACVRAAEIRIGSGINMEALSKAGALARYEPACKLGFPRACMALYRDLGAFTPEDYDLTSHYPATVRACDTGLELACVALLDHLTPEPPFGCDRCDLESNEYGALRGGGFDERCTECEIVACRARHCCPTCEGREGFACCGSEAANMRVHPERAPALDAAKAKRILAAARSGTAKARALWTAGCERGHEPMCLVEDLDDRLRELEQHIATLTAR